MANSPEYQVMISSTNVLVDAMVAEDPKAISDDLVSQELITHDLYKEMSLDSRTSKENARKLMQAVTDKVKCNPSEIFSKFLVVLRQHKMSDLEAELKSKIDGLLREGTVAAVIHDTTKTSGAANTDGSDVLVLKGSKFKEECTTTPGTRSCVCVQEMHVKASIDYFEDEFSEVAKQLLCHLKNNNTKVEILTTYISVLPYSVNMYVYPMWKKIRRKIKPNDNLESLFAVLNGEIWNILNYHLLEYFIKKCGTQKLKQRMIKYIYDLNEFKKATLVSHFMKCWEVHMNIPDFEEMKVKFSANHMTLADLDEFRKKVKHKCFPSILNYWWSYYKSFEDGCFVVCWLLPDQLELLLKENIQYLHKLFMEYNVIEVILGEVSVYDGQHTLGDHQDNTSSSVGVEKRVWPPTSETIAFDSPKVTHSAYFYQMLFNLAKEFTQDETLKLGHVFRTQFTASFYEKFGNNPLKLLDHLMQKGVFTIDKPEKLAIIMKLLEFQDKQATVEEFIHESSYSVSSSIGVRIKRELPSTADTPEVEMGTYMLMQPLSQQYISKSIISPLIEDYSSAIHSATQRLEGRRIRSSPFLFAEKESPSTRVMKEVNDEDDMYAISHTDILSPPSNVRATIHELERQFAELVKGVHEDLQNNVEKISKIPFMMQFKLPQRLKGIRKYIAFESITIEMFPKFFQELDQLWGFLDFELLICIIIFYNNEHLNIKLKIYQRNFGKFCDVTTIQELIEHWMPIFDENEIPDQLKSCVRELSWDPKRTKVKDLKGIQKKLKDSLPQELAMAAFYSCQSKLSSVTMEQHKWRLCWNQKDMTMPFSMSRNIQVLFLNGMLYIGGGDAERTEVENEFKIMSYNMSSNHWNEAISYRTKWFAMVSVDNKLTLVGGCDKDRKDANIVGVRKNENWTFPFPSMPTSRSHCSAATYKIWLIVAGGVTIDLDTLSIIEVLNLDTKQWQNVCDASITFYAMKSVVLDDTWYLMGGYCGYTITHDVYAVQLNDLVANQESINTWKELPKLRYFYSSPVLMGNKLLAVGGRISAYDSADTIYMYRTDENKWILAGLLPCALNNCASVIISNMMYIFGGYDGANRQKSIHTCSFNEYS